MTTILAIGVESAAETFLQEKGFMLASEASCSKGRLCDLTESGNYEVAVLGGTSRLGPGAVGRLREQSIRIPAIQILKGPRDGNQTWSRRCVEFLDAGGDNVIEGPSRPEELAYAVSSVLRRSPDTSERYRFEHNDQSLQIDVARAQVRANRQLVRLTAFELKLLIALARRGGIVSRADLVTDLYDGDARSANTIEVFVVRARIILGDARALLVTHHGRGYELVGRRM